MNGHTPYYKIYYLPEIDEELIYILEKLRPLILVIENKPTDNTNIFIDYVNTNYYYVETTNIHSRKDYFDDNRYIEPYLGSHETLKFYYRPYDNETRGRAIKIKQEQLDNMNHIICLSRRDITTSPTNLNIDNFIIFKLPENIITSHGFTRSVYIFSKRQNRTKKAINQHDNNKQ